MRPSPRRPATPASILVAIAVCCLSAPAAAENYALVIGISEYDYTAVKNGVVPLEFADDDALEMERLLKEQYRVRRLINAEARREGILKEFRRLREQVTADDTFLLFFAGHGVRDPTNQKTYWLAYDAKLDLIDDNGIRLEHLLDYVREIRANRKLVLLDHCFSGDLVDAAPPRAQATSERASLASEPSIDRRGIFMVDEIERQLEGRSRGIVVLAAARNAAFETGSFGHGLFTEALRRSFSTREADGENGDGLLSIAEMSAFVRRTVAGLAANAGREQQIRTLRFDVEDEENWPPVLRLPPKGSEAEIASAGYLELLRKWEGKGLIDVETLLECGNALRIWVETLQKQAAEEAAGRPVPAMDAGALSVVDVVRKYAEIVRRRSDLENQSAKELQNAIRRERPFSAPQ